MSLTFYWHDYETWGSDPSIDRPCQFAGVRTDADLNIIGEPLVTYCRPPEDIWPHPEACLVTGITPQKALAEGLYEKDFIRKIHGELSEPGTCGVGYNSVRFDDEITRYTLYRNYYDPYEREWKNGNSRWDIIDMVRLVYALRPEGIEWPIVDDKPSFKLENLTAANGLAHKSAHDAYSDVEATIALAKLIREKQPKLFDYVLSNRSKRAVASFFDIASCKPLLHISSKFPASRGCAGFVAPLAMHPVNKNAVIVYDLTVDPTPMATITPEQIAERVFTSQDALGEVPRLPVKLIHLNKCPVVGTTKLLDSKAADRLGIDRELCEKHWQLLKQMQVGAQVGEKLQAMYRASTFAPSSDPETRLYDGFIGDKDKALMREVRQADTDTLANTNFVFEDNRLNQMLMRYRARNFPDSLSPSEKEEWCVFVADRLRNGDDKVLGYDAFGERVSALRIEHKTDSEKLKILDKLCEYREQNMRRFQALEND